MWALVIACTAGPLPSPPDSGTIDTDGDGDGDGFLHWQIAANPSLADCDDQDASVTPETERLIPEGLLLPGHTSDDNAMPQREIWLSPFCMDVLDSTTRPSRPS